MHMSILKTLKEAYSKELFLIGLNLVPSKLIWLRFLYCCYSNIRRPYWGEGIAREKDLFTTKGGSGSRSSLPCDGVSVYCYLSVPIAAISFCCYKKKNSANDRGTHPRDI